MINLDDSQHRSPHNATLSNCDSHKYQACILYTFCPMRIEFGTEDQNIMLDIYQFCENWCSESYSLLKAVYEILPLLSIFIRPILIKSAHEMSTQIYWVKISTMEGPLSLGLYTNFFLHSPHLLACMGTVYIIIHAHNASEHLWVSQKSEQRRPDCSYRHK